MNQSNTNPLDADYRVRFVVLFHEFPTGHERENHWDLMLEWDSKLITYALDEPPEPGKTINARALPDHRKHYLDYEGQISNDRGSVSRVLEGNYFWVSDQHRSRSSLAVLEFEGGRWKVEFLKHVAMENGDSEDSAESVSFTTLN